jgi:hypothetical protein
MTRPLLGLADRLRCLGVTRVVMEATSDYWKPVFYLLEAAGFDAWLVNAKDVKHLFPGAEDADEWVIDGADVGERESPAGWLAGGALVSEAPLLVGRVPVSRR